MLRWLVNRLHPQRLLIIALFIFGFVAIFWFWPFVSNVSKKTSSPEVLLPSIVNGNLVLPNITTPAGNLTNKLIVLSLNLAAITENQQITGIRIVGELANPLAKHITQISPVVRFIGTNDTTIGQKVAKFVTGYEFTGLDPEGKTLYNVVVDNPPQSEKIELSFNIASSSSVPEFIPLKIKDRQTELKSASGSGQMVDYYIVSGTIVNPHINGVTGIVAYVWGKDKNDQVFALGRVGFENDLLSPEGELDFKTTLLPFKEGNDYSSIEIGVWGKEYGLL